MNRMASKSEIVADHVRDHGAESESIGDGSALRGLIIGLILTAFVAGCVEMIL